MLWKWYSLKDSPIILYHILGTSNEQLWGVTNRKKTKINENERTYNGVNKMNKTKYKIISILNTKTTLKTRNNSNNAKFSNNIKLFVKYYK